VDGERDNERVQLGGVVETAIRTGRAATKLLVEYILVVLIFAGSLLMWIGLPLGWLWLVTRVLEHYPEAYAGALFGCPVTMTLFGLLLARLNRIYLRLTGRHPEQQRTAWLKSLSGERGPRRQRTVLDTSMTISVVLAMIVITIWFFFYAHSYLPGLPAP
jgi:hypothetical protein